MLVIQILTWDNNTHIEGLNQLKVFAISPLSLSPIRHGFAPGFVNYKKGCIRLAAASDKVYLMVGGSLWVLRLLPSLKLVVMI
jgi:hypothetical protein